MSDTLEIFGKEYTNVKGFKAFDDNGNQITYAKASGGAPIVVASGSFTGSGSNTKTFTIGAKMPQTDFWLKIKPQSTAIFPYDNKENFGYCFIICMSDRNHFDLSNTGDKYGISDVSFNAYDSSSETVTVTLGNSSSGNNKVISNWVGVKNAAIVTGSFNNIKITKETTGFSILLNYSNNNYNWPSTVTYNWELVYFGNNPSTDIVEVAV